MVADHQGGWHQGLVALAQSRCRNGRGDCGRNSRLPSRRDRGAAVRHQKRTRHATNANDLKQKLSKINEPRGGEVDVIRLLPKGRSRQEFCAMEPLQLQRQRKPSSTWREGCEGTRIVLGERRGIGVALGGTQPQARNALGQRHSAGHAVENRDTNRPLEITRQVRHTGATEHDRFGAILGERAFDLVLDGPARL
jgi:hypothetical protein